MPVGPPQKKTEQPVPQKETPQKKSTVKKSGVTTPETPSKTNTVSNVSTQIDQTKEEVLKLNRVIKFYTKNSTTPIQISVPDLVNSVIQSSKDSNISLPLAYVRKVYEVYGDNIFQIVIPKEYENDLSGKQISINLQLENFHSLFNLIIEQSDEYVILRINNNVLEKKSYNDKSNITFKSISIQPNNKLKPAGQNYPYPDKSNTIAVLKKQLGYQTDQNELMTNEFSEFIKDYQKKNQLPVTGEIDYDLVVQVYPKLKQSETTTTPPPVTPKNDGGEKTTTAIPQINNEFANNRNVKSILNYSQNIDLTGEPDWDSCRMLIDVYSKNIPTIVQAISVGNMSKISENDTTLKNIKKSVEWCIAKHRNKFRLKISDMNRISNLETPFNINKDIL
jgi:hypothetical protein